VFARIGRVLIAVGLLLFGFAAYQLWGTGIQQARAQSKLAAEFDKPIELTSSTTVAAPVTTMSSTPTGVTDSAVATTTTTLPNDPELLSAINAKDGEKIARIEIPSIDVKQIVVSGVTIDDLRKGPGHYRNTPLPGQRGNAAIAAHRTGFGGPFVDLDKLKPGDKIIVSYRNRDRYVYTVRESKVVLPSDLSVLDPSDEPIITLTTCTPKTTSDKRLIVIGVLDEQETTSPVRPVTVHADEPVDELPAGSTTPPVVTTNATGSATTAAARGTAVDAFAMGWFSDKLAAPHVGLWGLALTVISLGAWQVSRRTRRNLVGFAVGFVPFLVVLYFFYENVARLLPPTV
jgi:sortase A